MLRSAIWLCTQYKGGAVGLRLQWDIHAPEKDHLPSVYRDFAAVAILTVREVRMREIVPRVRTEGTVAVLPELFSPLHPDRVGIGELGGMLLSRPEKNQLRFRLGQIFCPPNQIVAHHSTSEKGYKNERFNVTLGTRSSS